MRLADAPAVEDDPVALAPVGMVGSDHRSGEIDARNQRPAAHDRRLAGDGQTVLVVDRRRLDRDGDVTLHQIGVGQVDDIDRLPLVLVAGNQDRLETVGHRSSLR